MTLRKEKKYEAPAAEALLSLLEFFSSNPGSWGPTDLARRLDLTPNLTFRILSVLAERGYVVKNSSGHYELTSALYSLGMNLRNRYDLRTLARPYLQELAVSAMESAQIQIPDGDQMMQFDYVAPPSPYYLVITPGTRVYWHGNAFGKVVLAHLSEEEQEKIFSLPRPSMTKHTITDLSRIRQELEEIRETGIGMEVEEYLEGFYCIAAPVFNAAGKVVAAVGITGMTSRLDQKMLPELQKHILTCSCRISEAAGWKKQEK